MNQKKTKKPVKKEILLILLGIFFVALFLVFMNSFYETVWERSGIDEAEEIQTYDYQYAMIVDGGNDDCGTRCTPAPGNRRRNTE